MGISALRTVPLVIVLAVFPCFSALAADGETVWTFDSLDKIGGLTVKAEGNPALIETPAGKAVLFDGVDDALFIDKHPMAGFKTFTFEAIFRPDGGAEAQRWFHLASVDPATGLAANPTGTSDPNARFLFEIRVVNGTEWYLDAFTNGDGYSRALMFRDKVHPVGRWYAVAQTYDGKTYRSYVNGVLQGEAALEFKPQPPGRSSVGVRINRVNYFKGAILKARFMERALPPGELLTIPAGLR
ncbi:MAG: LamG domain-containing protein [Candidatus Korobacteraceae bacterium]